MVVRANPAVSHKVLAIIDEANVWGATRTFNKVLNWLALRDYLINPSEGREGEIAVYIGLPPVNMEEFQEQRNRKLRFVHWLRTQGFLVVTKDGSPTGDGNYKANVDVLMAIDAMDLAVQIKPDIVVLGTGDSDFAHLALSLRRRGIRVEVAAVDQTLGNELKAAASSVIDLRTLFNTFENFRPDVHNRIGGEGVMD